ncbi:MAG: hypothetical protein VXV71_01855, partial [Candidatus Thermoplasmatota archaeon]|nr:hypothetical protein [Candidatus Thermoplasmatota archaeon]
MAIERLLTGSIRERVQDLMSTEDLIIESFKDIVKDELKAHIRNKIEEDPDLHAEIKEAVAYYFHQKARSVYAELKATRAATRLGLRLLPDELQGEIYTNEIKNNIRSGSAIAFAHGLNIHFNLIEPRNDIDVFMVAP